MLKSRKWVAVGLLGLLTVPIIGLVIIADDVKLDEVAKPLVVDQKVAVEKDQAATPPAAVTKEAGTKENCAVPEKCNDCKTGVAKSRPEGSHKQLRVISPKHNGEKITLNTFCLGRDGEILMCVGGPQVEYTPKDDDPTQYDIKRIDSASLVQRYSADEQLLAEYPVEFKPTAINLIPGKDEFVVAGEGWLVRMTLAGEVIKKSRTPNIGDYEEFKVKALEAAKEDLKQYVQQFEIQKKQAEQTIEELEKKPEADRNANDKAQIEAQKSMLKMFNDQIGQFEQMFDVDDPEQAVRDRLTITGIAAADSDLFISIRKLKGHGYQVWRTNFDFEQGEKVVDDLGGCCGQLDIQASGDKLLIAENGKFRVGIYDRDGDLAKSFGKRDRKANEGFGSCCNPMNIRCCDGGEVLTAESSIGDIKRFSADGKFLGYVGRAKIGGGCKHVAIAFDSTRNRYYMQHQDKGQICVLVPKEEVTGLTEDELLAKEAREGLGQKLVGTWEIPGAKKEKKKGLFGLFSGALGGAPSQTPGDKLTFGEDGNLAVVGGQLSQYAVGSELEWLPSRQNGNQLEVGIAMDGVENFNIKVVFESDDELKIDLRMEENVMASGTYRRVPTKPPAKNKPDDKLTKNE